MKSYPLKLKNTKTGEIEHFAGLYLCFMKLRLPRKKKKEMIKHFGRASFFHWKNSMISFMGETASKMGRNTYVFMKAKKH